jgi:hypothetical protein
VSDQALAVRNDQTLEFNYNEAATQLKTAALGLGALVGTVTNGEQQQKAVDAQREISRILGLIEKARVAAKGPVLDFGRQIDDKAKKFSEELKEEHLRIAKLVGDFQQLEQARVRAAEQLRLAEERRIAEERRQAEQRALDEAAAERRKLDQAAADIARKASEAKNAVDRAKAETERLELERQRALAEAKSHDDLDRINQEHNDRVAELPVAAAVRSEGQRVVNVWEVIVTDIWLLAKAHPACVKIEPRLNEIKSLLDAGVKVAGVSAKKETKSQVTASRGMPAINV